MVFLLRPIHGLCIMTRVFPEKDIKSLEKMLEKEYIDNWYTCFAAGAVLISITIAALFMYLQKYYVDGLTGGVKG